MGKSWFVIGLILTLYTFSLQAKNQEQSWELVRDEDSIKLYSRDVEGSAFKESRAEAVMNASLYNIMALFKDVASCEKWRYQCKWMTDITVDFHYRLNHSPWPFSDRYVVIRSVHKNDNRSKTYTIQFHNERIRDLPGVVRANLPDTSRGTEMRKWSGFWKFEFQQDGIVKVTHEIHVGPGGLIPAAIANRRLVSEHFDTLRKMRLLLKDQKYQIKRR